MSMGDAGLVLVLVLVLAGVVVLLVVVVVVAVMVVVVAACSCGGGANITDDHVRTTHAYDLEPFILKSGVDLDGHITCLRREEPPDEKVGLPEKEIRILCDLVQARD